MTVSQARFRLPRSPFIGFRLNPKYRSWWISILMTILIAVPMSLVMKDICNVVMLNEQRITLNVCVRPDITGAFIGKYN